MKIQVSGISFATLAIALMAPATLARAATTSVSGAPEQAETAQKAGDNSGGVQEIVVTAERRTANVQKTPLTIQVLSADAIARSGVTSPNQLTTLVPGVQIGTSGPATSVYIRGVGGYSSVGGSNPAVPYYNDEVYVARTQSEVSEFYDVDRIEVLKGPQGTLYGRNASGGAINVLTRAPVLGEYQVRGSAEIGNYSNYNGELAVNIPLGDKLALRASGTVVDKGGFTSVGFGQDYHYSGRLKLLWKPTSDFSLLLNGSYGHIWGGSAAYVALNRDIPGWYPWLDTSDPKTQAYIYAHAIAPAPFVRAATTTDANQDLSFYNFSAQLKWNLGFANLTVIPAYRHSSMRYATLTGFEVNNGDAFGTFPAHPLISKASSIEARLSGDAGPVRYVAGVFYYNEDQVEQYYVNGGFLQSSAVLTVLGNRTYAAFGQATFALSHKVRLIGGLRYTSDRRAVDGLTYVLSPSLFPGAPPPEGAACAFPAPTQPQCLVDDYTGRKTFTNLSFKGGFEADVLANSLLYATVSRGFKAGGFNIQSGPDAPASDLLTSNPKPGGALLIRPELLTSYEAGLKNRFLNNKLQVNLSAFYWDYKDHQEPVITYTNVPGVTNLVFFNAGVSKIYGGTIDVVARPWRGGTISGSLEYDHSRYDSFDKTIPTFAYSPLATGCRVGSQNPATTTLDCSGFEVSRTPKWSGLFDATQAFAFGPGQIIAEGSVAYASARWLGTDFVPIERAKSYGKVDLSLTYQAPGDQWSITGFVRNVTNASIYTDAALNPFSPLAYGHIQPPRSYGARLEFHF